MAADGHRLAIIGAGIGGLSAALALLQKGVDVDVFEQAGELRELGAGLLISMNGVRVLRALGLEDEVKSIDLPADDRVIRLWNTGESRSLYHRQAGASADHSVYMLHRAELQRILAEGVVKLKPDALHLGRRCVRAFERDGKTVAKFEAGDEHVADALIGADGVHSSVRRSLFGSSEGRYTGSIAWRGLVPIERLSSVHSRPLATTWIGPTAHITCYPLRLGAREMVSFSAQVERADWALESWSTVGSVDEALGDFVGWHSEVVEMIRGADTLFKWGLFVRAPLARWTVGGITLLGDACHSMVPYLGQGVIMALEDAYVLARCVQSCDGDLAQRLRRYEQARHARGDEAAARSAEMQAVFHHRALAEPGTAFPYIERHWSREAVKARYDWLFEYDAAMASI